MVIRSKIGADFETVNNRLKVAIERRAPFWYLGSQYFRGRDEQN